MSEKYEDIEDKYKVLYQNMQKIIGRPAAFEGFAEESIELAEVALIAAGVSDGSNQNYTGAEAGKALIEEYTDAVQFAITLGIDAVKCNNVEKTKPWPVLYRDLAEACLKLAKASMKMARCIRQENPTPVTEEEALRNVKQCYQEVRDIAQVLGLLVDKTQMFRKYRRFESQRKEAEENKCIS